MHARKESIKEARKPYASLSNLGIESDQTLSFFASLALVLPRESWNDFTKQKDIGK